MPVTSDAARFARIEADVRDARDIAVRLDAQNLPARFTELRDDVNVATNAVRTDVAAANSLIRTEAAGQAADFEKRIKALEDWRSETRGVGSVFDWLAKHAPWLLAITLAIAAALGIRGPHH